MDEKQREIETLIKNIHKGLRCMNISELNKALVTALSKRNDGKKYIEYAMRMVCEHFDITITALKQKHVRGNVQDAKQMCYCLLHLDLGYSMNYIASDIFNCWPRSVVVGINRIKQNNSKINSEAEFMKKYKYLQSKLADYVSNN